METNRCKYTFIVNERMTVARERLVALSMKMYYFQKMILIRLLIKTRRSNIATSLDIITSS